MFLATVNDIARAAGSGTGQSQLDAIQARVDRGEMTLADVRKMFGVPDDAASPLLPLLAVAVVVYLLWKSWKS